jgi:hypothetical protein
MMSTDWDEECEKAKEEWIDKGIADNLLWPEDGHAGVANDAWDAAIAWVKKAMLRQMLGG